MRRRRAGAGIQGWGYFVSRAHLSPLAALGPGLRAPEGGQSATCHAGAAPPRPQEPRPHATPAAEFSYLSAGGGAGSRTNGGLFPKRDLELWSIRAEPPACRGGQVATLTAAAVFPRSIWPARHRTSLDGGKLCHGCGSLTAFFGAVERRKY